MWHTRVCPLGWRSMVFQKSARQSYHGLAGRSGAEDTRLSIRMDAAETYPLAGRRLQFVLSMIVELEA